MFNYSNYQSNKNEIILKMENVKKILAELNGIGIDVNDTLKKIESSIEAIKSDELSIVLVGAFSDGKTSVVAGWLNEKMDNMKIDTDESSDEILKYKPDSLPEGCVIVDTPGLFGNKIGSDEDGAEIVLSEKTKKYISEANIILYVVTAKNPIKDSHKSCINWILNDLNKLSTIIFAINRMDDVADLTDEEEFQTQKKIKTENLQSKLLECGVSREDVESVKVVCISAAPDGKGIDEWKNYREEYLKRSHMISLEEATNDVLKKSKDVLIVKTGCDVLNEEVNKLLTELEENEKAIAEIVLPEQKESFKRNTKDLSDLKNRVNRSRIDFKKELKTLQKNKCHKIRSATMENYRDILEEEIGITPGNEGFVLGEDISDIINKYTDVYSSLVIQTKDRFDAEFEKQEETINSLFKMASNGASTFLKGTAFAGVEAIKTTIFAGRDALKGIGIIIKFKPWQVVKLANFASKALPIVGAGIDVVTNLIENISTSVRNNKFENNKTELKNEINKIFEDLIKNVNDDSWFFENCAPGVLALENVIKEEEKNIKELENKSEEYKKWADKMRKIDSSLV